MDETTEDGWPFPSPCGEKVGINDGEIHNGEYVRVMFPSPCGEKVGINDGFTQSQVDWMLQFPSPCGEKVGINTTGKTREKLNNTTVSVPLRGKGRDQR